MDYSNPLDELTTGPREFGPEKRDAVSRIVDRQYGRTLRNAVERAIEEGYNGVDVSHIELECLSRRSKMDVWQMQKWHEEPPEPPAEHGTRFDFRYYDRRALLQALKYGERPR